MLIVKVYATCDKVSKWQIMVDFAGKNCSYRMKYLMTKMSICIKASFYQNLINTDDNNDNIPSKIDLFPNPASEQLYVNHFELSDIKIRDVSGKIFDVTKFLGEEHSTVDISSLPSGFYIFSLEDSKGNISNHKIMIQN